VRVITCDPHRTEGARSNRVQEFRAEDVFLETPVRARDGIYEAPRKQDGLRCIGLQWAETRPVRELAIEFAEDIPVPPPDGAKVEYWTGESPWQGTWKTLNGTIAVDGNRWTLPVSRKETPEFPRMGIDKVRWIFPASPLPIAVKKLSAFTRARLDSATLRVELETPRPGEKGVIEIYNGLFTEGADTDSPLRHAWDLGGPVQLKLQFTKPRPWKSDRTVLRIALPSGGCGVAVEDVIKSGCVYVRDLGLYAAQGIPGFDQGQEDDPRTRSRNARPDVRAGDGEDSQSHPRPRADDAVARVRQPEGRGASRRRDPVHALRR
jgi:hypothetical protein